MSLYRSKYRIESSRLKRWDYRNAGAYFITICTKNRECFFGKCYNGEMRLNAIGKMVDGYWQEIPDHFKNVRLGVHIIMPNHIHGILIVDTVAVSAAANDVDIDVFVETLQCNVSTDGNDNSAKNQFMSSISPEPGSVSAIVRSYKSACTKWANQNFLTLKFSWQERFYDHIIRNNEEYIRIENYILNNSKNWTEDKFHPQNPASNK